jgi:hypothetical protein
VVPLVAVSGAECVDALAMAGFASHGHTEAETTMSKGLRVVVVPAAALLAPEELLAVLKSAGLAYAQFLDLLSEAPTEPAISRTRPRQHHADRGGRT